MIQSICLFCGSNSGQCAEYSRHAEQLGIQLAAHEIRLVYGGGRVGLMGVVADAILAAGGLVTGVIPRALAELEIAHDRLSELIVVETMHERKAIMADMADAFIALPGHVRQGRRQERSYGPGSPGGDGPRRVLCHFKPSVRLLHGFGGGQGIQDLLSDAEQIGFESAAAGEHLSHCGRR